MYWWKYSDNDVDVGRSNGRRRTVAVGAHVVRTGSFSRAAVAIRRSVGRPACQPANTPHLAFSAVPSYVILQVNGLIVRIYVYYVHVRTNYIFQHTRSASAFSQRTTSSSFQS